MSVSSAGIWFQFNLFSSSMLFLRKNSKMILKGYFGIACFWFHFFAQVLRIEAFVCIFH